MSHYIAQRNRTTRFCRGVRVWGIAAAFGIAAIGGASASAVWASHATVDDSVIGSGSLDVQHGEGTWVQVTPGVRDPDSGSLEQLRNTFVAMPGDVLELRVPFNTVMQGENLRADLRVGMGEAMKAAQKSGAIRANYRIETAAGELVAPAAGAVELNERVGIEAPRNKTSGTPIGWQAVVTVTLTGAYHWSGAKDPQIFTLLGSDGIQITLEQVRRSAAPTVGAN